MKKQIKFYKGKPTKASFSLFEIDCTGDVCTGDIVLFKRAIFEGTYPNSVFSGYETIIGKIVKDSYGAKKQQHTFSVDVIYSDYTFYSKNIRIKGRNLYKNGTKRIEWENEEERKKVLSEKHKRGDKARKKRFERKYYNNF